MAVPRLTHTSPQGMVPRVGMTAQVVRAILVWCRLRSHGSRAICYLRVWMGAGVDRALQALMAEGRLTPLWGFP